MPTAFATATRADARRSWRRRRSAIRRPRQLERRAAVRRRQGRAGRAQTLGLETVGDLLEHLPRDRREARSVSDADRRGRPRRSWSRSGGSPRVRCAGAGCGRWSRRRSPTRRGSLRVTFFNQPWLVDRYPPGTRLMLHGKADGRGRFTVQGHAPTGERPARRRAGHARRRRRRRRRTTRPPTGSPRPRSWRWCTSTPRNFDDVLEPLPASRAAARAAARPPGGAARRALSRAATTTRSRARRRLAFEELLLAQLALQHAGAAAARASAVGAGAGRSPRPDRPLARARAAVRADRRPADARSRRSTPTSRGASRCSGC